MDVRSLHSRWCLAVAAVAWAMIAAPVAAQTTAFKQAVAEAAAGNKAVTEFYRDRGWRPIWTRREDRARRTAFLQALDQAGMHALPTARFSPDGLVQAFRSARTTQALGRVEAKASRLFVAYAHAVQSGILQPHRVAPGIKRRAPRRGGAALLDAFARSTPSAFLRSLPPQTPEYARLMREKERLERVVGAGGWGAKVPNGTLRPGQSGGHVTALRNRLVTMGYMPRSAASAYGGAMQEAVRTFQRDHGLAVDGVAGPGTLASLNVSAGTRLSQIVVAMERERWLNRSRGNRHILVNITDYSARIIDNGRVTMRTRAVVGAAAQDRRTPEFSDRMEYIMINPRWNVPRSITVKEYLPKLKRDRNAVGRMDIVDSRGRTVRRGDIDFAQYTKSSFPYRMVEPPSPNNALGRVKFMFPNKYNIYLHDTPAQQLFQSNARAFSHGCIRLNDPYRFAYTLLAAQTADPQGFFQSRLRTGKETRVQLAQPVPVHIIYRTALTRAKGRTQFREDVYGRDARIFGALQDAGVRLRAVRG